MNSPMKKTVEMGVEFWNDSCHPGELQEALRQGAVGATSNPVIVLSAIQDEPQKWGLYLDKMLRSFAHRSEDELAWCLVEELGREGAGILSQTYESSGGAAGYLCLQTNPKFFNNTERMVEHGLRLRGVAENVAIKCPATEEGIRAMEELSSRGVVVNATVCFTVSQALACAEAIDRGLKVARGRGLPVNNLRPVVTIMVGRLDDQLKRDEAVLKLGVDPQSMDWAGIAVFRRARALFREKGHQARLLSAAYRHDKHWRELIGSGIVQSIPYPWWTKFNAEVAPTRSTLDQPVDDRMMSDLLQFKSFREAAEEGALKPHQFSRWCASLHTLNQFLEGYDKLVAWVRGRMLRGES